VRRDNLGETGGRKREREENIPTERTKEEKRIKRGDTQKE